MSKDRRLKESAPLRIGVSACLLGEEVRFDGGHKRLRFATDQLGPFVEWVAVCPELQSGMGVPRPALRLMRDGDSIRMIEIQSKRDHTRSMERFAAKRVRALRELGLSGFLLKKDSPSCGMTRVKVYRPQGTAIRDGRGLFAQALTNACPNLPVEDEGRLDDARLRENWIERLFAYRWLQDLFGSRWTRARVVDFHSAHKLQLMAHSTTAYRALGQLIAATEDVPRSRFRAGYEAGFMAALARLATPGRNANTLEHAARHLKDSLDSASRSELAERIREYRKGGVPLVVPLTLLAHHARRHEIEVLSEQTYLEPHPRS
jgi:uncharacterized protein YbbK (DUF523 family)/uncharacterized protein YbgA (DUF1722 family)